MSSLGHGEMSQRPPRGAASSLGRLYCLGALRLALHSSAHEATFFGWDNPVHIHNWKAGQGELGLQSWTKQADFSALTCVAQVIGSLPVSQDTCLQVCSPVRARAGGG